MLKNKDFLQLKKLAIKIEHNIILVSKDEADPIKVSPGEIITLTDLLNTMGRMQTLINAGFEIDNKTFAITANGDDTITVKRISNEDETLKGIKWEDIDPIIDDLNEAVKIFVDQAPKQSRHPNSQYQAFNN